MLLLCGLNKKKFIRRHTEAAFIAERQSACPRSFGGNWDAMKRLAGIISLLLTARFSTNKKLLKNLDEQIFQQLFP